MRKRRLGLSGLVFFILLIQWNATPYVAAQGQGGENAVLKAMVDEMQRSKEKLRMEGVDKPYHIQYRINDIDQFSVEASFGSVVQAARSRNRMLTTSVRVGDYALDNTNFVSFNPFSSLGSRESVTVEENYDAIRHELWLATDRAYKEALEALARKKAYLKNMVAEEPMDDFSREQPNVRLEPQAVVAYDPEVWKKKIRALSDLFKKYPQINDSGVDFQISVVNKYLVNSEGFKIRVPAVLVSLRARASTQAADGMKLKNFVSFYANSLEQLAPAEQIARSIEAMAAELAQVKDAPLLESYSGPILFEGQAAGALVRQVFVKNLSGQRPPLTERREMARLYGSETEWKSKIKSKVLPEFIGVTANPTQTRYNERALIGSYPVDDEGIPAREVRLIEKGVLEEFLMSRVPRKDFQKSNGHGRESLREGIAVQPGNILVKSAQELPYNELKSKLIELSKKQGREFGILIKTLDDPAVTGAELDSFVSFSRSEPSETTRLTQPLLVYKVYVKDGKEELVRGVELAGLSARALRDIVATGNDYYVYSFLNTSGSQSFSALSGLFGLRVVPVASSVVTPALLIEEAELKKIEGKKEKVPYISHP